MSEFKVTVLSRQAPRPKRQRQVAPAVGAILYLAARTLGLTLKFARWLCRPRNPTIVFLAIFGAIAYFGTPHLLITYRCSDAYTYIRCSECRYFGIQGMRTHVGKNSDCPYLTVLPIRWTALFNQFVS